MLVALKLLQNPQQAQQKSGELRKDGVSGLTPLGYETGNRGN